MTAPVYLSYYLLAGSVAIVAAILFGLHRGLVMAGWSNQDRRRIGRLSAVVLIGWFGAAIALGALGVYRGTSDHLSTIGYGILVPILIGGWLILRSSTLARVLEAVPQHWLIGVQVYRVLGVIFLILYGTGNLPGLFAWPSGLGDVLVGVLAPVVAIAYARGPHQNADLVRAWNIFGIVDLIIAVTMGFLTSPSAFQVFAFDLSSELVGAFPLVLIPTYAVPISILLHLASLAKLPGNARRAEALNHNLERHGAPA
jgi:hypothetical protein